MSPFNRSGVAAFGEKAKLRYNATISMSCVVSLASWRAIYFPSIRRTFDSAQDVPGFTETRPAIVRQPDVSASLVSNSFATSVSVDARFDFHRPAILARNFMLVHEHAEMSPK